MRPVLLALALSLGLPHTAAADQALFMVNSDYEELDDLRQMRVVLRTARGWSEIGFDVVEARNLTLPDMAQAMSAAVDGFDPAAPLLIVLGGHFVHTESGTWMLATDAEEPDIATLPATALSVELVMDLAAEASGRALVVLADGGEDDLGSGLGVSEGLGDLDVPSGVTVLTGPATAIADVLSGELREEGTVIRSLARDDDDLEAYGFLPPAVPFLPEGRVIDRPDEVVVPPLPQNDTELEFWLAMRELNTAASYQTYINRYPNGRFVETARSRLAAVSETPAQRAERLEGDLQLTRAQRQEIQRDLAILDYDTRGIDGIFGPGTRGAITAWQNANGFVATSYLTADQIVRLDNQAAIRAAQLEEQARQERLAEERRDRAFWRQTGQGQDEAGLRAYLDEFPDGLFAEVARARLDEIEAAQRAQAEAEQRAYWDAIRSEDTEEAYEEYLDRFPNGPFAAAASARLDELRRNSNMVAQARAEEQALNLPGFTQVLVERTLRDLGYDPGQIDGRFDENTRRAIRQYQNSRQLPVTGYLSQQTVVRLLAGGIGVIVQ